MEKDRNQLMLDSVNAAIVFFTEDMECIDCNSAAISMFRFSDKEEYISGFYRSMPPFQANGMPSAEFFKKLLLSAFKKGKARREIMCRQADGILVPADATLTRVTHEGQPVVICSFYNMTDIKQEIKKAVSASEIAQFYLSAAPLAMELFNDQYRIIDCNQQALELLDFTNKTEYMKRNTDEGPAYLYHDIYTLKKDKENYYKALSDGYARYEWVFQKKNGETLPCEITRARIVSPERIFVVSYIHDLRQIKSMAAELKKAEAIERESRAKNQFLAQMSHVLRTPLNVITGLTEIQLQKNHALEVEESFLQVRNQSEMLLRIINDILDLSNANTGNLDIASKNVDVPSLIIDIAQQVVIERELENVQLNLRVDEKLPSTLVGDDMRIKQVAHTLLGNAFKYTESGTVSLHFYAAPPVEGYDITMVITVNDTGQGMSPLQVKNLFDTQSTRYNEQGTIQGVGLGLVVTHRVIQMMHGTIEVESEKGLGSTFTVRLPFNVVGDTLLGVDVAKKLQDIETARDALKQRKTIEYEPMPYGKVLVVDDVESNLYVAAGLMKPYGLQIDTAVGGIASVEKIKKGAEYDIIFMDHMMPDLDGIQAAKAIMDLGCETPIVALTANVIMGQAALFKENGFSGFLSKPINMKQLNSYLLRFIRDIYPEEAAAARAAGPISSASQPELGVSEELAKHFIRDAKNAVSVLEELVQHKTLSPENIKRYTITTHGMKSALANVNVPDLSKTAASLEDAGRHNDNEKITAQTPLFLTHLKNVIATFESTLAKSTDNQTEDDPVLVKEQLTQVIEACDNYSKPAAKKALAVLKEGQVSAKTLELIDEISALLLHGEFEQAAELAQGFLSS